MHQTKIKVMTSKTHAMAPLSPANHKTHCILSGILFTPFCLQQLARKEIGKMFNARAIKQNSSPSNANTTSQFLKLLVKTSMPIYKNTMVSVIVANVAKNCSVDTCAVFDRLYEL